MKNNTFKTIDTTDERFGKAVEKVAYAISRHTGQLFSANAVGDLKPLGSCVLIQIEELYYICTAAHVLSDAKNLSPIYILTADGMVQLLGKKITYPISNINIVDIGYVQIADSLIEVLKGTFKFLQMSSITNTSQLTKNPCLMSFGFPEKSSKVVGNQLVPSANYFMHSLVSDKVFSYYKLQPDLHYALTHAGAGINIRTNSKESINGEPTGMSGCGLWYLRPSLCAKSGELTMTYYLIGIMTAYRKGRYHMLISDKINAFMQAIAVDDKA
ncbi:hypothetical protein CLV58_1585 [Spirosoma oryzae]|uniref:Trypsin-like peptidase n=1 Tax=Spirosoma oryzae TaxID=1469603 RepID=A0A2T0RGV4_9BACT|nr:hypothetical protein [Spirosoma oryzae]PRY20398.1 hypothetical protein CLV58_1585 [Spirosoma oryzae]